MRRSIFVCLLFAAAGCGDREMSPEQKARTVGDLHAVREYLKDKYGDRIEEVQFWPTRLMWHDHRAFKKKVAGWLADPTKTDTDRRDYTQRLEQAKKEGPGLCCRIQYIVIEDPPSEWVHDDIFMYFDGHGFLPISSSYEEAGDFPGWSGAMFRKERSK